MSLSNWTNLKGFDKSVDLSANCPVVTPSCDGSIAKFSYIEISSTGSEEIAPPPPAPKGTTFESFYFRFTESN